MVFGEEAELYDRARPSYPSALIDDVVALIGGAGRVVDAGCGTGKASVLLASRGLSGIGIEPHPEMARIARRRLGSYPRWRVDIGGFEDWRPKAHDVPVDAVVSAQAWHWFRPDVRFERAHALIPPGGWLALWWNGPQQFESPVRSLIDEAYARHAPEIAFRGSHRGAPGWTRPPLDPLPHPSQFGTPVERHYPWAAQYTSTQWTDFLRTTSDHRMLPNERRDALLGAVREAIDAHGGTYDHPYTCSLWAAQRGRASQS